MPAQLTTSFLKLLTIISIAAKDLYIRGCKLIDEGIAIFSDIRSEGLFSLMGVVFMTFSSVIQFLKAYARFGMLNAIGPKFLRQYLGKALIF